MSEASTRSPEWLCFPETQRWQTTKEVPLNLLMTVPSCKMDNAWTEKRLGAEWAAVTYSRHSYVSHMQAAFCLSHSSQSEHIQYSAMLC